MTRSPAHSPDRFLPASAATSPSATGKPSRSWTKGGRWLAKLITRAITAAEDAVAKLLYWQEVSRTIQRLSLLDDARLAAMGLERSEIVSKVYNAARRGRSG